MMTAANIEILTAYEQLDMSVDQIAEEFPEYEVSAIKAILLAHSRIYRQAFIDGLVSLDEPEVLATSNGITASANGQGTNDSERSEPDLTTANGQLTNGHVAHNGKKKEDISDAEFDEINQAYKKLALTAENEAVREKALRNLRDEKRGRLPAQVETRAAQLQQVQVNILEFNDMLKRAKMLSSGLLNNGNGRDKVIDIPSSNGSQQVVMEKVS